MHFNLVKTYFPLFVFLIASLSFGQPDEKVVAAVGSYKIYESEFKERFDFSVHPGIMKNSDEQSIKKEFLQQLIAEKLLSLRAKELGYDTTEIIRDMVTPLDNMYTRDALYKKEIKDKVTCTTEELEEGLSRIKKKLFVKFLYSTGQSEIKKLFSSLKAGASFDSLLSLRRESADQQVPREITFGTMEKEIEDSIYALNSGEFTSPLQSKDGYYIIRLVSDEYNSSTRSSDMVYEDVKRIVEKRSEYKNYLEYYRNFFSSRKIAADKDIFENLADNFTLLFSKKYSSSGKLYDTTKIYLRGTEVTAVLPGLNPGITEKPFIKIGDDPIFVKTFINQLSQEGLFVRDPGGISIRASLSAYIRKFIEDALLTREGINKGLDKSADVKKYTGMWKDAYLSQMLMLNLFDSVKVSDEEAFNFFRENEGENFPFEWVNIAEVLTDSLNIVETVLNELASGRDIKELARAYTKRDSLKDKGGEFGFFPVTRYGEIGRIASGLEVGQVYGPLKLDEGYSVFKVLGKKTAPLSEINDSNSDKDLDVVFSELKDQVVMQLSLNKFKNYVNEYNAGLAQKYGVKIDEEVLNNIKNTFLDLVVVRYMGFGGEIFAVPYTEQFSGWYEIWQQKTNLTP
jgi:parvulin-like peptidyl-prolyl isomerase